MKLKHLIIAFLLCIAGFTNYGQNSQILSDDPQTVPFQKLYLHTDREFYFSGDTLWFAAYLVDGISHSNIQIETCNLYVDLINANGEILKTELFLIINGLGSGYVSLPDSTDLEGNFLLRAYTDYLKNFGDNAFFTKTIRISKVKSSLELALENTPPVSALPDTSGQRPPLSPLTRGTVGAGGFEETAAKTGGTLDISFLPEGGFLLAGESNSVAFKAVDNTGKGRDVSGKLFDEKGNLVLNFKSLYKGAGKFFFYPKKGKTYTAKIDGLNELEFPLPEIRESGTKLKLINQEDKRIQLMVQEKNNNRKFPFHLVYVHRGKVLSELEIERDKVNTILRLSTNKLGDGINRIILYDKNRNPLSERLIFKKPDNICQFDVRLSDETFATREEVLLNLKAGDNWTQDFTSVSVSVVDENYLNATGVTQNIASYLLLDSELKGHIESPADYLISTDSLSTQTKLDLLMCTNGWSNYLWNTWNTNSTKKVFEPQLGFTFKGQVKRGFGKKMLDEGNVSMIVFRNDSTKQFVDQPLDLNGKFEFRNIVFYDSASVFVQARNKRNKNTVELDMELPRFVPPEINAANLNQLHNFSEISYSVYRQRYLNKMRLKEFYPDKNNIILEDIEVRAKQPRPKFKTGVPRKNDGPFKLTWEMTAGRFDIVEYLAYNVPGIFSYRNADNELMIKVQFGRDIGPPAFYIDGYQYFSINEIKAFNVSDFRTIEIITPPMSFAYGARAISGAVILTFRRGDEIDRTMPLFGGTVEKLNGFTPIREFYSPKYTPKNLASEAPDYRNTLYWNPQVNITSQEQDLIFYTCDNSSRYKVFIEGITTSGRIILGTGEFEVDRLLASDEKEVNAPVVTNDASSQSPSNSKEYNIVKELPLTKPRQIPLQNQLLGTVLNLKNEPVEFATIYNLSQNTSCISNAKGEFRLEAKIGDSIRIQHLNHQTKDFKIFKSNNKYLLTTTDFEIDEVVVSAKFAFELFEKSCKKTWETFKDENLTRAYGKVVQKYNTEISETVDLDLDIYQKKLKNFKKGEQAKPYKAQERIQTNDSVRNSEEEELIVKHFYPEIQHIYWVKMPELFNYIKKEDDKLIQLILTNKANYSHPCKVMVTINKKDTCLLSFAVLKQNVEMPIFTTTTNDDKMETGSASSQVKVTVNSVKIEEISYHVKETYHYVKYNYTKEFGYLSEYFYWGEIEGQENTNNSLEILEHIKIYNNGETGLKRRRNRRRIFNNSFVSSETKNRFEQSFWENDLQLGRFPANYKSLSDFKIEDE